jgi:hypothetical protein
MALERIRQRRAVAHARPRHGCSETRDSRTRQRRQPLRRLVLLPLRTFCFDGVVAAVDLRLFK